MGLMYCNDLLTIWIYIYIYLVCSYVYNNNLNFKKPYRNLASILFILANMDSIKIVAKTICSFWLSQNYPIFTLVTFLIKT
jgi:hypothetical protein